MKEIKLQVPTFNQGLRGIFVGCFLVMVIYENEMWWWARELKDMDMFLECRFWTIMIYTSAVILMPWMKELNREEECK